jgi:UPF0755 protein
VRTFFQIIIGVSLLCAIYSAVSTIRSVNTTLLVYSPYVLNVNKGDNLHKITNRLHKEGVLEKTFFLHWYFRVFSTPIVMQGDYKLLPGMTFSTLLSLLKNKKVIQYKVTLLEGWTLLQALEEIWSHSEIKRKLNEEDINRVLELDFLAEYAQYKHAEGLFFPDTYFFHKGISDVEILNMAHVKLKQVLDDAWLKRYDNIRVKSKYEALILGSIIEKESKLDYERPKISGVFHNRLKKGMRLETDPTVIYGMGADYTGNIRKKDLRAYTPYNTYVIEGLPPTPIALAGESAIYASVQPELSSKLFFVGDGFDGHVFSKTYAEHERAVKKYLRIIRQR